MKYLKYCFLILLLNFQSCDFLNNDDDNYENFYSCSMFNEIISWSKGVNPCTYNINYNNTSSFYKTGYFQITLKNARSSYNVNSKIVTINEGRNSISVTIDNCNFQDEIQKICFMIK